MEKVIAVDFDGCLCELAWPDIGRPNAPVIEKLIQMQSEGVKIILNTCRVDDYLSKAVGWCQSFGLSFDAVNENLPERIQLYGGDCRKISADEYWDDKAVCVRYSSE